MNFIHCAADGYRYDNSPSFFQLHDPSSRHKEFELDMKMRYGTGNDPERPPTPQAGDKYITIGAIAGLIIGGTLGVIFGGYCFNFLGGAIGLIGGLIIGGIIGAKIGNIIKNRKQKKRTNKSHSNLH